MTTSARSHASRFSLYLDLIRWNRPAGWLVLIWPTLSALWLAADGFPGWHLLLVFALGTILANIKIYELPNGGSITLFSMVPFILVSFRHGVKWGLFTGFVNSLLQMLLGFYAPPAPGLLPLVGMILLDYVLAFSFLGLACVFAKPFKNKLVGVAVGSAAVCVLRFLCSFLSGVLIWGNLSDGLPAWIYSLTYNGSYMLPEGIMTTIAVVLLYKAAPQLFSANN